MTQLEKLFDEILEHVRWTGDAVFVADEPASMPPKIGWSSGSKHWSVSLGQAARDLNAMEARGDQCAQRADTIRQALQTQTGRLKLAMSFPGQRQGDSHLPTFRCARCGRQSWVPSMAQRQHTPEECDRFMLCSVMED